MKSINQLIEEIYLTDAQRQLATRRLTRRGEIHLKAQSLPTFDEEAAWALILARVHSISNCVAHTCMHNRKEMTEATNLIAEWMLNHSVVRILGAGRALLAGSMPGNRMAHGGAQVSFMGGMVPMPNSILGGGIIACSASGLTKPVLEAMDIAKKNNTKIKIIGLASNDASDFQKLCDIFIGLYMPASDFVNPLSALADTEEYTISEILDGLVVMAGKKIGFDDIAWRRGHEDIGPTGPYSANKSQMV